MSLIVPATRAAAVAALEDFLPQVSSYASRRSFVRSGHREVSRLSPHIRRRLITEREIVLRVLEYSSFQAAEKFIQEVVWRTYWKGWLERNSVVWSECLLLESRLLQASRAMPWGELYDLACRGATKLSFFNDWMHELVETGYLHNHQRMWFASVWIHTLKIPWQLGAMLMYRHLLDGDPASNTLSWRWVAGLQTKGKSYLARPDNISTYSEGRWVPNSGELALDCCEPESGLIGVGLEVERLLGERSASSFNFTASFDGRGAAFDGRGVGGIAERYGVIITSEDLSIDGNLELLRGASAVALLRHRADNSQSLRGTSKVASFIRQAEDDAVARLALIGIEAKEISDESGEKIDKIEQKELKELDQIGGWIEDKKLSKVVVVLPRVGPERVRVDELAGGLIQKGVSLLSYRSAWDASLHDLADRGFFPFWERVKKRIERQDQPFRGVSTVV